MIISHKYKYLFIGLPFSASSAISKELHQQYQGEPFLRKHSLYHEFLKVATKEEKEYFVFAVLRNPMEMAATIYSKMKANEKGNFTNSELYVENGGHITKQQREKFDFIHSQNATFQQYFLKYFTKPYDNFSSMTLDNCDFVIRYENIAADYLKVLQCIGIENPRPLPVANKTAGKKDFYEYYTIDIKQQAIAVFGPFMEKYQYQFPSQWGKVNVPLSSKIYFRIFGILRRINQRFFKKKINRNSIKGSIYGDMQRKSKTD